MPEPGGGRQGRGSARPGKGTARGDAEVSPGAAREGAGPRWGGWGAEGAVTSRDATRVLQGTVTPLAGRDGVRSPRGAVAVGSATAPAPVVRGLQHRSWAGLVPSAPAAGRGRAAGGDWGGSKATVFPLGTRPELTWGRGRAPFSGLSAVFWGAASRKRRRRLRHGALAKGTRWAMGHLTEWARGS